MICKQEEEHQKKKASNKLFKDYLSDNELTAFSNLDLESAN